MSNFDPHAAAAALHEARQGRRLVEPLPQSVAPRSEAEGAAVQQALWHQHGAAAPAGFKIGATAKRMQEYLGLSGPAAGFMSTGGVHRSGATLRFTDFQRPGVECELAVRLGRDLPPGPCTMAQAAEAVAELMAGIELVENRYTDLALVGTPTMIGDQVYHAAAIVGEPGGGDWRDMDVAALRGSLIVDGHLRDEGVGADLMGHPLSCLAWLAGSLVAEAFGGLKAGQVVMLGSVTPPIWLSAPATVTVTFPPLPPVQVTLI
jgi:2-keto-4-pentenoate hydratase